MFQVVTGKVKVGGTVRLHREAAVPVVQVATQTVTAPATVLAEITVPADKTYRLSEVSVGGDTANRIDVVVNGAVVHTMFYPPYGMNHKTYAVLPKAAGGQQIQVISQLATAGSHTATIIAQDTTGE